MLFKSIPLSVSFGCLGEGQRIQIGTLGTTPVFVRRSNGELSTEIGDIASFKTGMEPVGQWVRRFQRRHPKIRF